MSKSDLQVEFEDFAAGQNEMAALRHTLRGLGMDGNAVHEGEPEPSKLDLAVTRVRDASMKTILPEGSKPPLDLKALLAAEIRFILKEFVKDDEEPTLISMLDVVTLGLTGEDDIKRFLIRHGVDLDNEADLQYTSKVLDEAIDFFNNIIASTRVNKINPLLKNTNSIKGIARIFQTAAGKYERHLVPEACGLLRIAAAIDFLNRDPLLSTLPEAEAALKKMYQRYFITEKGKTYFDPHIHGEIPMEIVSCELRTKVRRRMIAKLLHKPQNSAREVVDHIGMRVKTKSASDALRFLYTAFFKPNTAIFPGMTIRTDETKQKLFDEAALKEALRNPRKAAQLIHELTGEHSDVNSELVTIGDDKGDGLNRHSSEKYRAIQVTFDLPITRSNGQRMNFPIEIQIVDRASHIVNETEASHDHYVDNQTHSIRQRVVTRNNLLARFNAQKSKAKAKAKG